MNIRLVGSKENDKKIINEVVKSLNYNFSIEEVEDDYKDKYHIKHTPAIIVENVMITDYSKLSIKELKNILIQFIET